MAKQRINYSELSKFLPQDADEEAYALLSHYLNTAGTAAGGTYRKELITAGFSEENIKNAEKFFVTKNDRFKCQEKPKFTFIDLFAGIGGFRLAMQACGGQCVYSSEWDAAAKQTYYENFGEVPFGDITKSEIKAKIPENFDVLCAGFPCQAFSIAGYQKGFDDVRGTLFFDIAEILEKYRPKAFYLENVKNLKSHDNGRTFSKIMDVLENRLHYKVFEKVMNPCDYANIPQNRERIFIVGFNPDKVKLSSEFKFPDKIPLIKTIHDIIDDSIETSNFFYKANHIYYERMKDVIVNPNTIYQWRRVYIRENKSNLCPTLTANMGEGGHNVPIIKTYNGIRKLTPEECLGFQGFPVLVGYKYPLTIAQSKKYKQAGNSVTEPLIERVASTIIAVLENSR